MNWKEFKELGYDLTEAEVKKLYPDIIRSYTQVKRDILAAIKIQYDKYLDGIAPKYYYNEMIKYNRLLALERQISKDFIKASKNAEKLTVQAEQIAFSNNYYRMVYASQWLVPEYSMTVLPKALIELATVGTTSAWKSYTNKIIRDFGEPGLYKPQIGTLSDLFKKNRTNELAQIKQTVVKGLSRGSSYRSMAKEVSTVIGNVVREGGKVGFSGALANAMRIVTTESSRVMNDAAFANMQQLEAQDIDVKKMWSSTKDSRTRPAHARLDGKIKSLKAYFFIGQDKALKPKGFGRVKNNVRCRCTVVDIINDEPPTLMRARNPETGKNEVLDYKPFTKWADDKGLKIKKTGEIVA